MCELATCTHHEKVIEEMVEKAIDRQAGVIVAVTTGGVNSGIIEGITNGVTIGRDEFANGGTVGNGGRGGTLVKSGP